MSDTAPLRSAPEGGCSTPTPGLVGSTTRQERQDPSSSLGDAVAGQGPVGTPESSSHAPKILLQPHTPHLPVAGNAWWVPGSIPGPGSKTCQATTQWQSAPSLNLTCDDQWWCFFAAYPSCSASGKRNRLVNGLLPVQIRSRDFEGPGHQDRVAGAASYPKESFDES